jgi:hypothetical protein
VISHLKIIKVKKGDLTTQQLVTIIVLIASFLILLFLYFQLKPGEKSAGEICYNSVVLKAKSVLGNVQLNCKTHYLCLSDGEKCTRLPFAEVIDVGGRSEMDVIFDIFEQEREDCWNMFGEGKLDFESEGSCGICSRIAFGEAVDLSNLGPYRHPEILILYKIEDKGNHIIKPISSEDLANEKCKKFFTLA